MCPTLNSEVSGNHPMSRGRGRWCSLNVGGGQWGQNLMSKRINPEILWLLTLTVLQNRSYFFGNPWKPVFNILVSIMFQEREPYVSGISAWKEKPKCGVFVCIFLVLFCYLIGKYVFYFRIIQFYKTSIKTESSHVPITQFPLLAFYYSTYIWHNRWTNTNTLLLTEVQYFK